MHSVLVLVTQKPDLLAEQMFIEFGQFTGVIEFCTSKVDKIITVYNSIH